MWEVEFYTLPSGACPTQEFLDGLNKKDELPYVIREIDLLREFGNQLRRPHADILDDGIYELRIPIKHKQYRLLYFYFYRGKIIISHGLRKEAKVKTADIEKAKKHKADYFARHERKS
jgi:phage-related protein